LLAGAIGLLLVIIYSFFQYRGLALVTVGSLLVAALLTYLVVSLLSWRQGYHLSLAGVAGLIVAIGITADSFIVYFERVRDELRDGRSLGSAVESGWKRAVRTILVSDAVSLLAAVVLFSLTVGNVRGFAFTLGLTTLIDLAVVFLFTHPMLELLAKTKFFSSGHPWSGFDSKALGATSYVGRGAFRVAGSVPAGKAAKASKEATKRQTLAERKAAENRAADSKSGKSN
jgi:preprotein translocase subunit SecD